MNTKHIVTKASLDPDAPGTLQAVFSTFGVVDHGNDVVLASAFRDGQEVPLTWAHQWDKPIGKGVVRVEPDRAVFDGRFNLATTWGKDAYESVRFAGPLQEFSWGFRVTDSEMAEMGGKQVRLIKGADVYEVSPVLLGEGLGTHTLSVKRSEFGPTEEEEAEADEDEEEEEEELEDDEEEEAVKAAWTASFVNRLPDSAFAYIQPGGSKDDTGRTVPRSLRHFPHHGSGGSVDLPHLRNALSRAPQSEFGDRALPHLRRHASAEGVGEAAGRNPLPYTDHAEAVVSALDEFAARTRARTAMRAKEGRVLSAANRGRIAALLERMRESMADVEELLASTDPTPPDPDPEKSAVWAEFERAQERRRAALAAL